MTNSPTLATLPSLSTTLHTDDNDGKARLAQSTPTLKEINTFTRNQLDEFFPKKGSVTTFQGIVDISTINDFETLVVEITLKIWTMLRAHLKNMNQYQEDMEKVYKEAVQAQVRSYRSWLGTALLVANMALGACSIGFTILPSQTGGLCKKVGIFFHLITNRKSALKIAHSGVKVLKIGREMLNSASTLHKNYADADRTEAQSSENLTKSRSDKISKASEDAKNELSSLLQLIEKTYRDDADARKSITAR